MSAMIASTCFAANAGQKATITVVLVALVLVLLVTRLVIQITNALSAMRYLVEPAGQRGPTIVASLVLRSLLLESMVQGDGIS